MTKRGLIYFTIGVTITTASYSFFSDWMQTGMGIPQQMMQMTQPHPQRQVCECRCNK
jgi:hypothetical protein